MSITLKLLFKSIELIAETITGFDIIEFLTQFITPFLILVVFAFMAHRLNKKLTPLGVIIGVIVSVISGQFDFKIGIVISFLVMMYIYLQYITKNTSSVSNEIGGITND